MNQEVPCLGPGALSTKPPIDYEKQLKTPFDSNFGNVPIDLIPYHKLLCAVLRQALADVARKTAHANAAEAWLRDNRNGPFTAIWILDHLEIDQGKMIEAIKIFKRGKKFLARFVYDKQ